MNKSHYRTFIRYFSNPVSLSSLFSSQTLNPSLSLTSSQSLHFFSTGYPSNSCLEPSICKYSNSLPVYGYRSSCFRFPLFRFHNVSSSSDKISEGESPETIFSVGNDNDFDESELRGINDHGLIESNASKEHVSRIIELIENGGSSDLGQKLNSMRLDFKSITRIIRVLNHKKLSALEFFNWVKEFYPHLYYNPTLCNLIFDNCGRLEDYTTMMSLLKAFTSQNICLTEAAFTFIVALDSETDSIIESITMLVHVLNEAGGSCCNSGVFALIKTLCASDMFDLAKFVIEITERKLSYYNILVRDKCKRSQIEEVYLLFDEMRGFGCDPDTQTYNSLLGCLCRNGKIDEAHGILNEMQEKGSPPDALSYEILIYFSCRYENIESMTRFLVQLISTGIVPRATTHRFVIEGYFNAKQYELAYEYVVRASSWHEQSSNVGYDLLAGLHEREGDVVFARNVVMEMMDKGLRPSFVVYKRIVNKLFKAGKRDLALDLRSRFRKLRLELCTTT